MTTSVLSWGSATRRRMMQWSAAAFAGVVTRPAPGVAAQEATPASDDQAASAERLAEMLRLVPDAVQGAPLFSWADLATQLAVAGLPAPDSAEDLGGEFIQVTQALALPSDIFQHASSPDYEDTFGFAPVQIEQALEAGQSPERLKLLRGRFSARTLTRAWERSGYEPFERAVGTIWSFADGPEFDPSSLVSLFGAGAMNNAAILDDGTVVFAPTIVLVESVLSVAAGEADSLAEREDLATLLATVPAELVSAMMLEGDALSFEDEFMTPEARQQIEELRAEQEVAVGEMPAVTSALFGITAGVHLPEGSEDMPSIDPDAPAPTVVVRLLTDSTEDAGRAAEVVAYRWSEWPSLVTGQPLSGLLELERAEASEEELVLELDFAATDERPVAVWYQLIYNGDLAAFGP